MQVLYRKDNRTKEMRPVKIERIWQDSSGVQVCLTPGGNYTYIDGRPVTNPEHFSILPEDEQEKALAWFRATGGDTDMISHWQERKKTSDEIPEWFKKYVESQQNKLVEDEQFNAKMKVLYSKQLEKSSLGKPPSEWKELGFRKQPDWWGKVAQMKIKDRAGREFIYTRYFTPYQAEDFVQDDNDSQPTGDPKEGKSK